MKWILILSLVGAVPQWPILREARVQMLEITQFEPVLNMGFPWQGSEYYLVAWEHGEGWYIADRMRIRHLPQFGPRRCIIATAMDKEIWVVHFVTAFKSISTEERSRDEHWIAAAERNIVIFRQ